jgi:hypothetical protein
MSTLSRQRSFRKYSSQDEVTRQFLSDRGLRSTKADEITWMLGWYSREDSFGEDRLWRHKIFTRYSDPFAERLAELYAERYRSDGRHAAAVWLSDRHAAFARIRFDLALDELKIKRTAEDAARAARVALSGLNVDLGEVAASLCARYRLKPPSCKHRQGLAARLKCPRWWRRNLRRSHGMLFEQQARACGLVNSMRGRYASDETVQRRAEQRANTRQLLKALIATNELGAELSLEAIFERSESNPPLRRAALMARMAGFERVANEHGYVCVFYTITCPSRMHAYLDRGGEPNSRFDGATARRAQGHLRNQFAKARAKLARLRIQVFGFRVCEPHKDGTPHWHLWLFVRPEHRDQLRDVLRHYALQVDPEEPGADRYRFDEREIDPAKGSATGYVAKYISKHLDGKGLTADDYGTKIAASIPRVEAWASTWRIRQFQQIGGPPVGVWRELRRLTSAIDGVPAVESARVAADNGDWAAYYAAQGGPNVGRRCMPIRTLRVWSDEPGRYGEPKGYLTHGVVAGSLAIPTRMHSWTISVRGDTAADGRNLSTGWPDGVRESEASGRPGLGGRPDASQSPQPAGVPVSRSVWPLSPWSPVNNCTHPYPGIGTPLLDGISAPVNRRTR